MQSLKSISQRICLQPFQALVGGFVRWCLGLDVLLRFLPDGLLERHELTPPVDWLDLRSFGAGQLLGAHPPNISLLGVFTRLVP